jgi:putative transcriptional regulator
MHDQWPLEANSLLIADPFLQEEPFSRTVILLLSHHEEDGSVGLILNRRSPYLFHELFKTDASDAIPVFEGGPVATDTLHFIHRCPAIIPGGEALSDQLYWGGDFEAVKQAIHDKHLPLDQIRFFLGYSGWSAGQLHAELHEKSWLTAPMSEALLFDTPEAASWKVAIRSLGPAYHDLLHYPLDPQHN